MTHQLPRMMIRTLAAAGCLCLLITIQAFAESEMQQPNSVANGKTQQLEQVVAQDAEVTPACCTDSCCGDQCCGNGSCGNDCCGNGCCGNCCCEAVCCPKRVTEEVKKHCWCIKPELVCIPGFRFQLSCLKGDGCCDSCCDTCTGGDCCCGSGNCCDCAPPKCGRVRCINVLEKKEYTCEECGYEWEVKCIRTSNGCRRGKGGCCCPSCGCKSGCCADNDAPATDVQLTSAEEATPVEKTSKDSLGKRLTEWLRR